MESSGAESDSTTFNHNLRSSVRSILSADLTTPPTYQGDAEVQNRTWHRSSNYWVPRAVTLCRQVWPAAKHDTISVAFLAEGTHNKVFSITLQNHKSQWRRFVLRIPKREDTLPGVAGIMSYLWTTTSLRIPKIITWDPTRHNPLEHAFIILSRLPGQPLDKILPVLEHGHKIKLAQELARLYHQIEANTNNVAGSIRSHERVELPEYTLSTGTFVQPFGTEYHTIPGNPMDWGNADSRMLPLERLRRDLPGLSTNGIMLAIYRRRIYEAKNKRTPLDHLLEYYEPCQNMIQDMIDIGLFKLENNVISLHHPDLMPRNIMVDFTPDIVITGVLDWDEALFTPRFAGRVLPRWLWRKLNSEEDEEEPLDTVENEPDSSENAEVKRAFERAVGGEWLSEATDKHFPFARKLLRFGHRDNPEDYDKIWMWERRWNALLDKPTSSQASLPSGENLDCVSSIDSGSSGEDPDSVSSLSSDSRGESLDSSSSSDSDSSGEDPGSSSSSDSDSGDEAPSGDETSLPNKAPQFSECCEPRCKQAMLPLLLVSAAFITIVLARRPQLLGRFGLGQG